MARLARKELADLRAMEEEHERMNNMRGGKRFVGAGMVGAGATPSMGLSQFRGGAKKGRKSKKQKHEEMEMEGGALFPNLSGIIGRVGRFIRPRVPVRAPVVRPTSTAIVPYVPRPVLRPPSSTAIVPYRPPSSSTALLASRFSKPQQSEAFYNNLFRGATTPAMASSISSSTRAYATRIAAALGKRLRGITPARVLQALSLGIPAAMLFSYFSDKGNDGGGDSGYYDDFIAGDDGGDDGAGDGGAGDGFDDGLGDGGMDDGSGVPPDLNPDELAFYLQSGNLPDRYSFRQSRFGKGKLEMVHHEDSESDEEKHGGRSIRVPPPREPKRGPPKSDGRKARAEIVRKIMQERGVKLGEASRIVKAEGLY